MLTKHVTARESKGKKTLIRMTLACKKKIDSK